MEEARTTCPDAPVGQVWRDGDPPAFTDTHALKTSVHPGDESTQTHLADEGFASVMAAEDKQTNKQKQPRARSYYFS